MSQPYDSSAYHSYIRVPIVHFSLKFCSKDAQTAKVAGH